MLCNPEQEEDGHSGVKTGFLEEMTLEPGLEEQEEEDDIKAKENSTCERRGEKVGGIFEVADDVMIIQVCE